MLYRVARLAFHVMKAEKRSAEHIIIQDGGPQEHQIVIHETVVRESEGKAQGGVSSRG